MGGDESWNPTESRPLKETWVLELHPWVQWIGQGCPSTQRPQSTWFRGFNLPCPSEFPNICIGLHEDTGLSCDWILSVGALRLGRNACLGLPIDIPLDEACESWFRELKWKKLFATPNGVTLGSINVAKDTLVLIAGKTTTKQDLTREVHSRSLRNIEKLPIENLDPGMVKNHFKVTSTLELMSTVGKSVSMNNHFLTGRLGFPVSEQELFSNMGVPRLTVMEARAKDYCQSCLTQTHSLSTSSIEKDSAVFKIALGASLVQPEESKGILLCSKCLCDLVDDG